MTRRHRTKTAALVAYAEGHLSPEGRARLERHLERCEACRHELSAILLYEEMAHAARRTPVPEVNYERIEETLAHEAERVSREIIVARRRRPLLGAALVAGAFALAALAYVAVFGGEKSPTVRAPASTAERATAPEPVADPEPPLRALTPVVTLAAGTADVIASDGTRALEPGATLGEGDRVRTGEDGLVHVRVAHATAFIAPAGSELVLTRAREGDVEITLERGRVASEVAPLEPGSRYAVVADGYAIEVRGTRFEVSLDGGTAGVDLAEGRVAVHTPEGETIELEAPARWRSDGAVAEGEPEVAVPREAVELAEATPVRFAHPDLVRWEVDGTSIASAGSVRLRLAPGEHELRGWDARDRLFTALVRVASDPVVIEPAALRPEPPRLRPGHLPQEEIARVLQRARPQLARCYERALRLHPDVGGRLRLRVTVGLAGDVTRVNVLGADAAETSELRQCVTTYAARWTFPPPGGPVTFEVPLAFTARL